MVSVHLENDHYLVCNQTLLKIIRLHVLGCRPAGKVKFIYLPDPLGKCREIR